MKTYLFFISWHLMGVCGSLEQALQRAYEQGAPAGASWTEEDGRWELCEFAIEEHAVDKPMIKDDPTYLKMKARKDAAYLERNKCVALIARMARARGYLVAVTKTAIEGWSEDWHGCVYIELPTGQVSWHFHDSQAYLFEGLPKQNAQWDGHDTDEKYHRVEAAS